MNGPRKKRRMNAPDVRGNRSLYDRLPEHISLYLQANFWLASQFFDARKKGSRSKKFNAAASPSSSSPVPLTSFRSTTRCEKKRCLLYPFASFVQKVRGSFHQFQPILCQKYFIRWVIVKLFVTVGLLLYSFVFESLFIERNI